ncbi:MAG: lipoyl(octanoyl) transferase LipB [Conexivisphaerales archaeon]
MIELIDLGRKEYSEVWELQKKFVNLRANDQINDTLILVEHEHVITLGRRTSPENFREQRIPVFVVERGGDATYHGPGQLVGYPIIKMIKPDVKSYLRSLEEVLIAAARNFKIYAERHEGHTGVWVGQKKLASIGVAVSNWVTYHGFALNVNTDLSYFQLIKPCGLDPLTMTSLKKLLGRELDMNEVKMKVVESFSKVFNAEIVEQKSMIY